MSVIFIVILLFPAFKHREKSTHHLLVLLWKLHFANNAQHAKLIFFLKNPHHFPPILTKNQAELLNFFGGFACFFV